MLCSAGVVKIQPQSLLGSGEEDVLVLNMAAILFNGAELFVQIFNMLLIKSDEKCSSGFREKAIAEYKCMDTRI